MSDLIAKCQLSDSKDCPPAPLRQKILTRKAVIGEDITIHRALPHKERRTIGAWCFLDHFGPISLRQSGLNVAPHPHTGLQTFTWTMQGEILHRDSLGSEQIIQPGQVNLMTAGKGIAHSEESLPDTTLHGVQLWIALPDAVRHREPDFIHYSSMPTFNQNGLSFTLLAGEFAGLKAPTQVFSPLMGLYFRAEKEASTVLSLNPTFEYGLLPLVGQIEVDGDKLDTETMLYLGCGHSELAIQVPKDAQVLMVGGQPFEEEILIWWNFVARTKQEIAEAVHAWNGHTRFGEVRGYVGNRMVAPDLPG